MHVGIIHLIICPSVDLLCNCKPLCQPSLIIHVVNVVIQLHIIPLPLYKHHMMVYSKWKDMPIVVKSWNMYTLFTVDASVVKNTMLQSKYTNPCSKQSFTCYMHREGQVNGFLLFLLEGLHLTRAYCVECHVLTFCPPPPEGLHWHSYILLTPSISFHQPSQNITKSKIL